MNPPRKNPLLVLLPIIGIAVVFAIVLFPWMRRLDLLDPVLSLMTHLNATVWLIVLWWALHHLVFQLAALFRRPRPHPIQPASSRVRFAILYLTRDDFQPHACRSCLEQKYPADSFRVLICDDSEKMTYQAEIDGLAGHHDKAVVVRRTTQTGFKAGNINHAIRTRVHEEWFVIIDADQVLPPDYLESLSRVVAEQPEQVAFVQAGHEPEHLDGSEVGTSFQLALGLEILIFYQRELAWRESCGFMPFLGHGAAIRRKAWEALGGIPEIVSEDYAFALAVASAGNRGVYAETIRSKEAFPRDFGAFLVRLRKFAGGSAELFRHRVTAGFLSSGKASFTEKLDFLMLLLWYPLMPLVVLNGFLSAYVCHRLRDLEIAVLHPVLPYLFIAMLLLTVPVLVSVTRNPWQAIRYWLWASAIYSAALPVAAWYFVRHLVFPATFERTPKGNERSPRDLATSLVMCLFGLVTLGLSLMWWSPFSPVLVSHGLGYTSFPLYYWLDVKSPWGGLVRVLVWGPGLCLLWGLYTMWEWGKL